MTREEAKKIIEVLLFVNEKPLALERITEVLDGFSSGDVRGIIDELNSEYTSAERSFSIIEVGGGFQIMTDPLYAPWIRKLFIKEKKQRLSAPSLETLAIIAYKQPVTRADVEAIRGVNTEGVLDTLLDRELIRTVGRKDIPGRPFMYGTTRNFLTHFGLNSLNDLPKLKDFGEGDIQLGRDELIKKEGEGEDPAEVRGEKDKDVKELAQEDR
jgi:segregation and condensation protein B